MLTALAVTPLPKILVIFVLIKNLLHLHDEKLTKKTRRLCTKFTLSTNKIATKNKITQNKNELRTVRNGKTKKGGLSPTKLIVKVLDRLFSQINWEDPGTDILLSELVHHDIALISVHLR